MKYTDLSNEAKNNVAVFLYEQFGLIHPRAIEIYANLEGTTWSKDGDVMYIYGEATTSDIKYADILSKNF